MRKISFLKKYRHWIYLLVAILSLAGLFLVPEIRDEHMDLKKMCSKFEDGLSEHANHILENTDYILNDILPDSLQSTSEIDFEKFRNPEDPELTLLLYHGDSLIYWSDNRVPFYSSPSEFDEGKLE